MPRQQAPRAYPPPTLVPGPPDFSSIFRREFSYVWNTLRRLGIHARDLEDVALDVYPRALANRLDLRSWGSIYQLVALDPTHVYWVAPGLAGQSGAFPNATIYRAPR